MEPQDPNATNLDQIRDILFGQAHRGIEDRFANFERRLEGELASTAESARRDTVQLEQQLARRVSEAELQHQRLCDQQSGDTRALRQELSEARRALEQSQAAFKEEVTKWLDQLRSDLQSQLESLRGDTERSLHALSQSIAGLEDRKAERRALGEMLAQTARTLLNENNE